MSGTHAPPAEGWTIDELAARVTSTLAEQGVRAPSGRVTAVPDRRLIRWYATIGLLDPPLRTRGRVARYGQRHLWQLVAVKRRQAEGRTLAEIQAELTGATDAILRGAAGIATAAARSAPPDPPPTVTARDGFWRSAPLDVPAPTRPDRPPPRYQPARAVERYDHPPAAPRPPAASVPPVYPVPLHDTVTLMLPASPTADDLAALRAAAQPLLAALAERGLLAPPEPAPTPPPPQPAPPRPPPPPLPPQPAQSSPPRRPQ